tara:strand:- start:506 stop:1453 length:948 start_codon:yes stop_codon:yes gene_type:complete
MSSISIIVPVNNESENLNNFFNRLLPVLEENFIDYEVLFVNDGSEDNSAEIILKLCEVNSNIKLINLSRNFGAYNAVRAGSMLAEKDLTFWIAADLQDPPEFLTEMKNYISKGFDVVWGIRKERKDPLVRRILSNLFYFLLNKVSDTPYPPKGVDMCLMSAKVRKSFNNLTEKSGFIQSLVMNLGFNQKFIEYDRNKRVRGVSKWRSYRKLYDMASEMLITSSKFPFNQLLYLGTFGIPVALIKLVYSLVLQNGHSQLLIDLLIFLIAFIAFVSGWLGLYIYRTLVEVRNRPLYYLNNFQNLSKKQELKFKQLNE